jgi:hypothetical protein
MAARFERLSACTAIPEWVRKHNWAMWRFVMFAVINKYKP